MTDFLRLLKPAVTRCWLNDPSAFAASATVHPSARVTLAVLKFFLGQDEREDGESDDEEEPPPAAPSREDLYKAKHKVRSPAPVPNACTIRVANHGSVTSVWCLSVRGQQGCGYVRQLSCLEKHICQHGTLMPWWLAE